MSLHVGVAGFDYPDWQGTVYPKGIGRGSKRLEWLAQFVKCVEINSSFYRIPSRSSAEAWAKAVQDVKGFCFTAKLWQGFTHGDEWPPETDASAFLEALEPLVASGRLIAVLAQFPWKFADGGAARERLARIARSFGTALPLALEVRHASFGESDALEFIRFSGFSLATLDMPRSKAALAPHEELTGRLGYVRLHGRNVKEWFRKEAGRDQRYDYLYSREEVVKIAARIRRLAEKAEATVVIANNHFRGQAVANALEIVAEVSGKKVAVPEMLLQAYPRMVDVAVNPVGGGSGRVQRGLFDG